MKIILSTLAFAGMAWTAQAQVQTSASTCYAYTTCYNSWGQPIGTVSCQVYGYAHVFGYGGSGSSCQYQAVHGVGVQCAGYQQAYNSMTGQYGWTWKNFSSRCPGM